MSCEICGRRIEGKARKIMVDGSILEVCFSCANLGEKEIKEKPKASVKTRPVPTKISAIGLDELEIVSNYALAIKKARESKGLSQDDLAQKVGEKASVIRLIESGKMKPNIMTGKKLERALKIDLFTMVEE
jgi:putative transcription factor